MSRLGTLDLSTLAPPDALEVVNWKDTVALLKANLLLLFPDAADVIEDELEPLVYLTQNQASRDVQLRLMWNDKVRKVLLATSTGTTLDHLGAQFAVHRMVVQPEDTSVSPPRPAVMEDDYRYRRRIQLAPAAFSTTGCYEAYIFHALSADARVEDVEAYNHASGVSLQPGQVAVVILPAAGANDAEVAQIVRERLARSDIKSFTTDVSVSLAQLKPQDVTSVLYVQHGPSRVPVLTAARARVDAYFRGRRRVGRTLAHSGLMQALHTEGVEFATLPVPIGNVDPGPWSVIVPGTIDIKAEVLNA